MYSRYSRVFPALCMLHKFLTFVSHDFPRLAPHGYLAIGFMLSRTSEGWADTMFFKSIRYLAFFRYRYCDDISHDFSFHESRMERGSKAVSKGKETLVSLISSIWYRYRKPYFSFPNAWGSDSQCLVSCFCDGFWSVYFILLFAAAEMAYFR